MIWRGLWIGTVTGLLLGWYLWIIEQLTGKRVYTLLMNVDFIPKFRQIEVPFLLEWVFHLIISWGITLIIVVYLRRIGNVTEKRIWVLIGVLVGMATLSYFPLTILALTETPAVTDIIAFSYWFIGHIMYAILLKKLI